MDDPRGRTLQVTRYRCRWCGWTGAEGEMLCFFTSEEAWSKRICPGCRMWQTLGHYEKVTADGPPPRG
jgi:hypothetical protein